MSESLQAYLTTNLPPSLKGCDFSPLLQLAEKRLLRTQTQQSFLKYIEQFSTEAPPAKHHLLLIDKLQQVADGKIKRLMVFMPPGSAKSYYANVKFSEWVLGRQDGFKLITGTYSQEVSDKWGRRVRATIRTPEYQEVFGCKLSDDSQAASRFSVTNDGEYYGVGIQGSVTSFRADGMIIDDPVKGREEAESETLRKKIAAAYQDDLWTRLKPNAWQVLIMTRWHEDDLAGYILSKAKIGGEHWEVLSLPMEAEEGDILGRKPGERLWGEWFTPEMIAEAKLDSRRWSSLYQQRPTPLDGAVYKSSWFPRYVTLPQPPTRTMIVHSWDTAYKAGEHNDPSACTIWHITPSLYYIADVQKGRWEYHELRKRVFDLANEQKPDAILIEDKASGQSLIQELQAGTSHPVIAIKPEGDKETRARTTAAMVESRKVALPEQAHWLADYEHEMMSFPNGKHDDMVDSTSQFLRWIKERGGDSNTEFMAMMDRLYG